MTTHIRAHSLAIGLGAFLVVGMPAMALAQPYDQGGPGPGDYQGQPYNQGGNDQERRAYDAQYGPGAYDRAVAEDDQSREQAREACHQQKQGNAVAGGVLGGIAGAVIGSNVARGGGREGGAIIGGAAGAVAGSQIAKGQTNCN